jgi:hypothetical protein
VANLAPLATVPDLEAALQREVLAASAELALASASAIIRRWTRQDITLVENDVVRLRISNPAELVLPQRPVVEVTQVRKGVLPLTDWALSGDRLLRAGGWRYLPGTSTWPDDGLVEVTYTHGYAQIPDDVRAVCVDLAAMTLANPSGLRSATIDDYSQTFASETLGSGSLSAAHREILGFYRRRIGTVGLR